MKLAGAIENHQSVCKKDSIVLSLILSTVFEELLADDYGEAITQYQYQAGVFEYHVLYSQITHIAVVKKTALSEQSKSTTFECWNAMEFDFHALALKQELMQQVYTLENIAMAMYPEIQQGGLSPVKHY